MRTSPSLRVLWLALALPCGLHAANEIDWTPRVTDVFAEGISLKRLYFRAGTQKFAMSLDMETNPEASGGGAKFTFKKLPSAVFLIRPIAEKVALPVPANRLEDYHRAALAYAPPGATDFSDLEDSLDPLNINQWKSYRLVFTYNYFGQRTRHSVTFLTLENGQQAVVETSAFLKEFTEAMVRSDHLIRTWHQLPDESAGTPPRNSGN